MSNIAWDPQEDDEVAALLREAGVDAVELAPSKIWPDVTLATPAQSQEEALRWRDRGLEVLATQSLLFGRPDLALFEDEGQREKMLTHLEHVLALGAGLGAHAQVFGSPRNRRRNELAFEPAFEIAVQAFRRLGDRAVELGTALCLEANPERYGADFMTTADEAASVVRAVDSPGVRLHLDSACMALGGDDVDVVVRDHIELVQHVHLSSVDLGPVGQPDEGHDLLLGALRRAGYDGSVSVEMRPDPVDRPAAVARAVTYARGLLARP